MSAFSAGERFALAALVVLCLGYKAEAIKHFFLSYNEAMANDFVLSDGGARVHLLKTDIHNWNITFVDTGVNSNIGQRLLRVREHLKGEEMFLANYSDGLTNLDCAAHVATFERSNKTACFISVPHPGCHAAFRWKISTGSPARSPIVIASLMAAMRSLPSSRMCVAYVPPYFAATRAISTNSSVDANVPGG